MFGYVIPDKPYLMMKDYVLYRSLYCGICVATGKKYGQVARLTTNYDITFLSALLHNYLNHDVTVKETRCALHHIKKRPIAQPDEVTDQICAANLMLVYYNLTDDILDEGGLRKRAARTGIRRAVRKVKKQYPELEPMVRDSYERLRKLEQAGCDSIDRLADCFATMMRDIAAFVVKEQPCEEILTLAYHFGKWVYLIDAVDDLAKDFERKQFNPYLSAFKDYDSRDAFVERHSADIRFSLYDSLEAIRSAYGKLKLHFNCDLTNNIVHQGLAKRTEGVLTGELAGKTPKV